MRSVRDRSIDEDKSRILHVDQYPISQAGFAALVAREPAWEVCGQTAGGSAALEAIERLEPDLTVMDLNLEGINGIELIKIIKSRHPKMPILVLSLQDELEYGERALRAGAQGYVMKRAPLDEVFQAVRDVLRGETYLSQRLRSRVVQKFLRGNGGDSRFGIEALSDRELEVFGLIGRGHKTQQIARQLNVSVKTVETHRAHIKQKINLRDGMALVRHAVQWVTLQEHRPE